MNAEVPASDGEAEHHSSTTSSVSQQTTAQQTIFKQRAQKSKQTRQNRAQKTDHELCVEFCEQTCKCRRWQAV